MAETLQEVQYVSKIDMCSDHAQTMTTIRNRTDVVWSISNLDGTSPVVTFTGETATSRLYREIRPDVGTRPLMLSGATAHISASPQTIRWTIEPALSVALVPLDTIVDELVEFGATRLESTSKGRNALIACTTAVYSVAKTSYDAVNGDDIVDIILGGVGAAGAGLSCTSNLTAALRERGRPWPAAFGLDELGRLFGDASKWASRTNTVLDTLQVVRALGPG